LEESERILAELVDLVRQQLAEVRDALLLFGLLKARIAEKRRRGNGVGGHAIWIEILNDLFYGRSYIAGLGEVSICFSG
jgi:hypothetical protein